MVYLLTGLEVIMAMFAVIGVYSLSRVISQKCFGSRELILAVTLFDEDALSKAQDLIEEALSQFLLVPSGKIVILTTEAGKENPVLLRVAEQHGVEIAVCSYIENNSYIEK